MSTKIWIDGQCLQTPSRRRGIGRYVQEFVRALAECGLNIDLSISFNAAMLDEAVGARDYVAQWIDPNSIHMWNGVAEGGEAVLGYTERRRLSEIAIAHHVSCLRPDIALSASPFEGMTDVAVPLTPMSVPATPIASMFYDAIPHRFAAHYLINKKWRDHYYRRLEFYKNFGLNLCISQYSMDESIDLSGNKNAVNIAAGVSMDMLRVIQEESRARDATKLNSILYVGGLDWRKNVKTLVQAIAELQPDIRRRVSLTLAGDHPEHPLAQIRARWDRSGLPPGNLHTLGHVSDSKLVSLYREASVVVQPSLLEGFGLTALEAMMCGAPILASNTGALPEVVGNPALLFDPMSPSELAVRLERILRDPEFAKATVQEGYARASQFTWRKSAEVAVAAMLRTAEEHRTAMKRSVASLSKLRQCAIRSLSASDLSDEIIANTLARAETPPTVPRRLLIDATATIIKDHGTGIQRVTKEITRAMLRLQEPESFVVYGDSAEGFFNAKFEGDSCGAAIDRNPKSRIYISGNDIVLMLDSSWEFHRAQLPLLLAGRLRGAEVISCLYDLVPLRVPAMCAQGMPALFVSWLQSALSYSTGFVCISQSVADELHALLKGIDFPREMKIAYWHLGADFMKGLPSSVAKPSSERSTFLMVGTLEPRKGHTVAIEAFETLWRDGADFTLIIVGKQGWGVEHLSAHIRAHNELGKRLFWYENVSDQELGELYARADTLIAASFAEGFGLPLVEARYFGKDVIASDIPAFREVAAVVGAVSFFEVGSSLSLVAAVVRSCRYDNTGPRVVKAENRIWRSWAESAAELHHLLRDNQWYRIYRPTAPRSYTSVFSHGITAVNRKLDLSDRQHALELIGRPFPCRGGKQLRYVVRVKNLSAKVWSSTGSSGSLGVFVGFHVLAADQSMIEYNNQHSVIPFVLLPGESVCVAIDVPLEFKDRGGAFTEVELLQEGVGWWGNSLVLPL